MTEDFNKLPVPACIIKIQHIYSSTCHERTPSGPDKSVRTLQVAARHRDGWAGGGRQILYTLQYYLLLSPPAIFLMNTLIVIINAT